MPDLGTQIGEARKAGYSDADITAYLAKDPSFGPKVAQAKAAGYSDGEIADHLNGPASAPAHENFYQKAARLTGEAYHSADQAYREDMQHTLQSHSLIDAGKTVMDAVGAATAPIKGVADAAFGDKPVALPFGINSKGLTPGDIVTMAVPAAGELRGAKLVVDAAKDAGLTARTMDKTLQASRAPSTIAANQLGVKPQAAGASENALSAGMPKGAVQAVKGDPSATVEALHGAKSAAYQAVDSSGVQYAPQAFQGMVQDIAKDAMADNISPERHPKAFSMLADMQAMAQKGRSPSLTELDQLRQVVRRDVAGSRDGAEAHFGKLIIDGIDNFVQAAKPADVIGGNAGAASDLITSARTANAQFRKAEAVTDALDAAKLRAGSTGSGGNVENATRQNLRRVLEKTPNLTGDEKAALESLVMGDKVRDALRLAGKLAPQGGGLGLMANIGAAGTGAIMGGAHGMALGSAPAVVGTGAKYAAEAITNSKVNELLRLIAAGGTRANLQAVDAWQRRLSTAEKAGPNAYSSAVGRLRTQMRTNPALAPLYLNAANVMRGAQPLPAAASPTNQAQGSTGQPY